MSRYFIDTGISQFFLIKLPVVLTRTCSLIEFLGQVELNDLALSFVRFSGPMGPNKL